MTRGGRIALGAAWAATAGLASGQTGLLLTQPGAAPSAGSTPAASAPAPAPPSPIPPAPTVPTVSSGTLPSTTPVSGPPPVMNVQFPPANVTASDGTSAPLYGTKLFTGAFAGSTISTRGDYVVQIGDTINVQTFGNVSLSIVARVNTDGKLFLPIIGPVTIAGTTRDALNGVIQNAVSSVYSNTRVYADIVQPGSVGVFVSGGVYRPGRYLGSTTDDLLYFLDKAGGIDGQRGSFRDVVVRHAGGREEHYDLYDFLTQGITAPRHFADGDTILVQSRGPQVVVSGLAQNAYAFELKLPPSVRPNESVEASYAGDVAGGGRQIMALAKPNTRLVTGAYVRSTRDRRPTSAYMPFDAFAGVALGDGDHVTFRSDEVQQTIAVSVQVTQAIPSVYIVPRTAMLQDVLSQIPQTSPTADYHSVYVVRNSTITDEKALLQQALIRLQEDAYAASALSLSSDTAQSNAAQLVPQFIQAAKEYQPSGQVAVWRNGVFENIRLQDGDQIVIPEKSDIVEVGGLALSPAGYAFHPGLRVIDYINDAGGFSAAANRKHLILHKPNGLAMVVKPDAVPEPGDQILIVSRVRGQTLDVIKDLATLAFPLAISAVAATR